METPLRHGLAIAFLLVLSTSAAAQVLATIKPIHSLVAGVMGSNPELLIQGAQSEHAYALKPSDAEKIGRARVIFEIGPDLETYLDRPLATLARGDVVVLERAPGMRLLPARKGGLWEDKSSGEGPTDPHLWLDPENAIAMTKAIVAALSKADPANAKRYAANGAKQIASLAALERGLRAKLSGLKGRYLVFHDAYQYFERRFGLRPVGAVTVAPDRPIGPRRLAALRQADAACIFREPQFPPHLIDALIEGGTAKVGVLDPLGADLAPGRDLYPKLLDNLARGLRDCLTPH